MIEQLHGPGAPLGPDDWRAAAQRLGVPEAHVRAVAQVEGAGSGFLERDPAGRRRPKILFEAHLFSRATGRRFDGSHPHLSSRTWNRTLYAGGAGEWRRIAEAAALDLPAALASASWGAFQILGMNHRLAGHEDPIAFARAHAIAEAQHLDAWCGFIRARGLSDELQDARWADFARAYNGPGYAANRYDAKLAAAAVEWTRRLWSTPAETPDAIVMVPDERREAAALQAALNAAGHAPPLTVDGWIGARTLGALQAFQRRMGLPVTAEADTATRAALGL